MIFRLHKYIVLLHPPLIIAKWNVRVGRARERETLKFCSNFRPGDMDLRTVGRKNCDLPPPCPMPVHGYGMFRAVSLIWSLHTYPQSSPPLSSGRKRKARRVIRTSAGPAAMAGRGRHNTGISPLVSWFAFGLIERTKKMGPWLTLKNR